MLEELEAITEHLTGAWMSGDYAQTYRRKTLRFLRCEYDAPVFEACPPDRVTLHPEDLPTLTGYTLPHPEGGIPRPFFLDSEGQAHTLPLGLDSLTIPQPDGSALLIFTGFRGVTDLRPMPGLALSFRVVAGLLPTVQATLAGADGEGTN